MTDLRTIGRLVPLAAVLGMASLMSAMSCSPDAPLPVVPDPGSVDCSVVESTYENFGARFFQDYCLRCHSVVLEDDWSRLDAPLSIDFDSLGLSREFSDRIRLRAGELGDMPPRLIPGPRPNDAERLQLIEWIDCGMLTEDEQAGG